MLMAGCSTSDSDTTSGEKSAGANDSDPINPVEPADLDEPADLVEPAKPQGPEPTAPQEPTEPTNPEQPTEPTDPEQPTEPTDPEQPVLLPVDTTGGIFVPSASDLVENTDLYLEDGYATPNVIRVDVRTVTTPGSCTVDDDSGCTLDDVEADVIDNDELTVDIEVHVSADDFADDGSISNASMRQRGGGARFADQKSFRIKLDSKNDLWRNERFLQLNKHPFESSRIRNKVAFDVMSQIPHLPSMRTQLVNLWIDDGEGPVDYGLFTHVERPNDDYLERHGLDKDGNLYQAEDFRFDADDLEDIAVDEDGEPLSDIRFESVLDIKEGKDHRGLFNMMSALHDPDRDFESVLDQYFNLNNVKTWMAVNILLQQADATRHNYYLYQPSDSEKFYFLPWDYDAALKGWDEPENNYEREPLRVRTTFGYSTSSENFFTTRYLQQSGIHDELVEATAYIRENYMTDSFMTETTNNLTMAASPFQQRAPDSTYNQFYRESSSLAVAENPRINEQAHRELFHIPTPPYLHEPERNGDQWRFSWAPAFSVTSQELSYDLEIANNPDFSASSTIVNIDNIADSDDVIAVDVNALSLPTGTYYARLTARSSNEPGRFWQVANNIFDSETDRYFGVITFDAP